MLIRIDIDNLGKTANPLVLLYLLSAYLIDLGKKKLFAFAVFGFCFKTTKSVALNLY